VSIRGVPVGFAIRTYAAGLAAHWVDFSDPFEYRGPAMKDNIHPTYQQITVFCNGCGDSFTTGSVLPEIRVSVCSKCHPFYTGQQKLLDTEGRVDRFKKKYGSKASAVTPVAGTPAAGSTPAAE
jgi:large subunit ribosomal protein L31